MKRKVYGVLLLVTFLVGMGAMLWPAFEAARDALSAGRAPGEYPGDHDCPPGQSAIEVVTGFREVFGGTTSSGTRTSLFCEDAAGNRVNVSQAELASEVSSVVRKVIIGLAVSFVAWIAFAVLLMMGGKSLISDMLHRPRVRQRPAQVSAYTVNVSGAEGGLSSLDPRTAEQVTNILEGLGIDLSNARFEAPEAESQGPRRTVAQRLQELSDLREAGLITREEYEEQRRAILRTLSDG